MGERGVQNGGKGGTKWGKPFCNVLKMNQLQAKIFSIVIIVIIVIISR